MLTEYSFDLLLGELENGWDHKWLDEGDEAVLIGGARVKVGLSLELSEEYNTWGGGSI